MSIKSRFIVPLAIILIFLSVTVYGILLSTKHQSYPPEILTAEETGKLAAYYQKTGNERYLSDLIQSQAHLYSSVYEMKNLMTRILWVMVFFEVILVISILWACKNPDGIRQSPRQKE